MKIKELIQKFANSELPITQPPFNRPGEMVPYTPATACSSRPANDANGIKINGASAAIEKIVVEKAKAAVLTSTRVVCVGTPNEEAFLTVQEEGSEFRVRMNAEMAAEAAEKADRYILFGILALEGPSDRNVVEALKNLGKLKTAVEKGVSPLPFSIRTATATISDFFACLGDLTVTQEVTLTNEEVQRAAAAGSSEKILDFPSFSFAAESGGKAKTPKKTPSKVLDEAKQGKYFVDHEFDFEVRKYIPDVSFLETYVPTPAYVRLLGVMYDVMSKSAVTAKSGRYALPLLNNFLLFGEPSGGKTVLLQALAASLRVPYFFVTGNQYTEDDAIEGKNKAVSGEIQFEPTQFTLAFEYGGIVALEELNLWNPNVSMGVLGQAIEGPQAIMKDGYIPVRRHPLCIAVATFNPCTRGSNDLNEALQTRFRVTEEIVRPSKRELVAIISRGDKAKAKPAAYVYDVYNKLTGWLRSEDIGQADLASVVTLRGCQAALDLFCMPESPYTMDEALQAGLLNQIVMKNDDLRKEAWAIIEGLPAYTEE